MTEMVNKTMDSKEKILKAALTLFNSAGFHGTSTAKIAAEAGVSNGTLFHYFSTKEALVSHLYLSLKANYQAFLVENMTNQPDDKAALKEQWCLCVKWRLSHPEAADFFSMFANSPYIDKLSKKQASNLFSFQMEMIEKAKENGTLVDIESDLLRSSFYSSISMYDRYSKLQPGRSEQDMETAFKMWWRSVVNI
ncbi:TetR/AcrR family transcriptional regulator [Oscillospiraceae bacterium OttesenSCG-928-F05]|nr:TetR/AcrR family transcriptional regulator [Oscillospiraceae bacterium OttesenSCG-928-F05]